ncbi:MAG: hypothetical protein JNK64_20885 [Myxococcales bacterium]|nr:hypothetical protein [Myxococcales bacterium]
MSRASRRPPAGAQIAQLTPNRAEAADDDLATRWREVGRLIESIDSELFATMVRTWEVTAVALANARRGAQ